MGILITGVGLVTTAGHTKECFWEKLYSGKNTYEQIPEYNNNNYRYSIGAKIKDEFWKDRLPESFINKYRGMASQYAASAAIAALDDAEVSKRDRDEYRIAICIGTTMGEIDIEEAISERIGQGETLARMADDLTHYQGHLIGAAVQEAIDAPHATTYILPAACSGGNYAIVVGAELIKSGRADIVIAGGVDVFSRVAFAGFQRLLSIDPTCCRPFDAKRKGLIVGEGCGMIIMEKEESAKSRKGKAYGELVGYGLASDCYHMIAPHPEGEGIIRAMREAVANAKISKCDIDYISAHGTGTRLNDLAESRAITSFFGKGSEPPISSIKSMLGHSMGAASALECIASLLMLENQVMLPTANYSVPDPELTLDYVVNEPRQSKLRYIMSNSLAFGGQVGSIILKRGM